MNSALQAVTPARVIASACSAPAGVRFRGKVRVLAVGKAAYGMAAATLEHFERTGIPIADGLLVTPSPVSDALQGFRTVLGEHPIPGEGSADGGRQALELARSNRAESGEFLVLLSGGASSLMVAPAEGIALADKRAVTATLLASGASIHELNAVRKHLSAIKGGWLGVEAGTVSTWALSDVVDDDAGTIGSGPTVPDPTTYEDALAVLAARGGADRYPRAVVERLRMGRLGVFAETPKPGDSRLVRSRFQILGNRRTAMDGAAAEARRRGYDVRVLDAAIVGEASHAAPVWLAQAVGRMGGRAGAGPTCVVSSGETTVRVVGSGKGGRNQEFALALVDQLDGRPDLLALASVGTDGIDGLTDAAGALVDVTSAARARALGLPSADAVLADNDSGRFFDALGDRLITGPTGTNVGDLQILVAA